MASIPPRRPPPPRPPLRRSAPLIPKDSDVRDASFGTDSGISESSSMSSLATVSSTSALSMPPSPDSSNCSHMSLSLSLSLAMAERAASDLEASVVSLPSHSNREVNPEVFSTSLVLPKKNLRRPPLPPVRNDSTMRKMIKCPRAIQSFEEKFSFHSMDVFPTPSPLTIEKKFYPSKELFSSSPPPDKKEEEEDIFKIMPQQPNKKIVKKPQRLSLDPATLFSRFRSKSPTESPSIKSSYKSVTECSKVYQSKSTEDSIKENMNVIQCKTPNKPPIAQKPTAAVLERTVSTVLSPRRQERGICRSLSVASPSPSRLARRSEGSLGNKIRREIVTRPAPPLPPPLR